ncbi:MAG: type 4b pilus protein PilO2 [Alphaproteobacteria bacterium]|nr:type 4b pilus protein PilO2 [Alphaproteobacteria bacterium]
MAGQVISIGRKKYATGLFWQPVGSARSAKDVAVKISESSPKAKFRYYAEYRNQVGLGSFALKHAAGMTPLAAEVAESFGDSTSFAAAFKVGSGYYTLAVRNGVILSDSDRLFNDENAARAAYASLLELPDWSLRVAPESWGIQGAEARTLEDLVTGRVKSALRPIHTTFGSVFNIALVLAAILGVLYFFSADINHMIARRPAASAMTEESARRFHEEMAARNIRPEAPAPKPEALVMPWDDIPDHSEVSARCVRAIAFVMQPVYGWNVVSAECQNGSIRALMRRDYGTVEDLYAVVNTIMPGIGIRITGTAGSDAELTGVFAKTPGESAAPEWSLSEIERRVRSVFQQVNMQVDISRGREIVSSEDGSVRKTAEFVRLRADSKIMPVEFAKFLEGIPSVELVSIRWDNVRNIWSYEEKIYAK